MHEEKVDGIDHSHPDSLMRVNQLSKQAGSTMAKRLQRNQEVGWFVENALDKHEVMPFGLGRSYVCWKGCILRTFETSRFYYDVPSSYVVEREDPTKTIASGRKKTKSLRMIGS